MAKPDFTNNLDLKSLFKHSANYLYLRRLYAMADEGPTELQDILFAFNSALSGQEVADSR